MPYKLKVLVLHERQGAETSLHEMQTHDLVIYQEKDDGPYEVVKNRFGDHGAKVTATTVQAFLDECGVRTSAT